MLKSSLSVQNYCALTLYALTLCALRIIITVKEKSTMPKTAKEMEKIILRDGWVCIGSVGSHRQYRHPKKPGKVTIPFHGGDLSIITEKSIRKQAGLK